MHSFTLITALLASSASLASAGRATINNYCGYNVVVTHVDGNGQQAGATIGSNGGVYSEDINGSGVSLKLTLDGNVYAGNVSLSPKSSFALSCSPLLTLHQENELDYSLATGQYGGLYWNFGSNGAPFQGQGLEAISSNPANKVVCPAGSTSCPGGTQWADPTSDLTVNLCRTD